MLLDTCVTPDTRVWRSPVVRSLVCSLVRMVGSVIPHQTSWPGPVRPHQNNTLFPLVWIIVICKFLKRFLVVCGLYLLQICGHIRKDSKLVHMEKLLTYIVYVECLLNAECAIEQNSLCVPKYTCTTFQKPLKILVLPKLSGKTRKAGWPWL